MSARSPFAARLHLVLSAIAMSRAKLASVLGVDKSLVGRWAAGSVKPSDHNLSRITAVVAERFPGFTALDWERDLNDFAENLGIDPSVARLDQPLPAVQGLPLQFIELARRNTEHRGAAYEGFWRTSRPSVLMPHLIFQDHGMIRRNANGLLEVRMGGAGLFFHGWMMLAEGNLFVIIHDSTGQTPLFLIFRGVPLPRAEVMEGMLLMAALNAGRTPAAVPILMERIGDLSGDSVEDDAKCDALINRQPTISVDEISDENRAYLLRDIGPNAADKGGDLFLLASGALTRGSTATGQLTG
jgi:transcriptional regulator with XRE-family HTH domain